MARLRVALCVPVGQPLPDITAFVLRCEDSGFDGVGIHDHPSSGRDAYLGPAHDLAATSEDRAHFIADAFGLFGSPERCAERLLRAQAEAGVEDVFLFPAHDLAGGYTMPEAELQAFERIVRPRIVG